MLTLHLNASDLSRTVVRSTPSVLLEVAAAGQRVFRPGGPEHLAAWQARTRAALRPGMRPLLDLCRLPHWLPDFLTPTGHATEVTAALDAVAATPAATLDAELRARIQAGDIPPRVAPLAAGDPVARQRLRAAMGAFHAVAVGPYWPTILAAVHADRAARGHTMVDAGIDRVLRDLSPYLHWTSSGATYRLSYECAFGTNLDVVPDGRGVTLVPSYLLPQPCVLDDPDGPLVLAYPIRPTRRELTTGQPLADLLGRTRAAVLGAIVGGPSTSQVARTLGISIASASQHAATLRSAGLITTHRAGSAVRHALTPLGEHLLRAARPARPAPTGSAGDGRPATVTRR
ncbi:winged helix-turn-helix domain-containing protein [Micromonospora sp. C28SCA-DRY-2]|uniref:ArsR/SmtB family transcription factor n=1 Tax=Micromonospora sp. C28SCA-DRY-2 TaxID=3059522 RepID=UPI0026748BCD|nr:winged helix-turn-helix domain-containing protein [Micromonospora sp. C28SCA-DRY-2]MDO3700685.1 winged helix-turn-helix domain-containing protein [Micromonospora sp. C28SCA-DRY-2]